MDLPAPFLIFSCLVFLNVDGIPNILGTIELNNPQLLSIYTHEDVESGPSRFSILASTFNTSAGSSDPAFALLQPGLDVGNDFSEVQPTLLFHLFHWPKSIAQVPDSLFRTPLVVTSDGSNITGKSAFGAIYLTDVTDFDFPSTADITSGGNPTEPWSYGKVQWKLVTGDNNRHDIITCRWQYENDALKFNQLVYLSQPLLEPLTSVWDLTVLFDSACDVNIVMTTIEDSLRNDWDVVYSAGLHSRKLAFFWAENALGNPGEWNRPEQIRGAILEDGQEYYDIRLADLNNDGSDEILVTILGNTDGSIVVYIPPSPEDFRNPAAYTKVTLAGNFTARNHGPFGRSPGITRVFHPTSSQTTKPLILLAGEDDGRGYYLQPRSEHPDDWTYDLLAIVDNGPGHSVKGAVVMDIDGDGYSEAFFSVHSRNLIQVFTFRDSDL